MAFKNQGTTIISDAGDVTVDKFTVTANARQTVGITATTSPTSALSPSVFQGSVSGYSSGGTSPTYTNIIDKFPFASDTNATDVGDLIQARASLAGQSSTTHGYSTTGIFSPPPVSYNTIDKFPFAIDTNATGVGNMTQNRRSSTGQSSSTHGYVSGGYTTAGAYSIRNTIDKFPFATDSNGTDVGDLTGLRQVPTGQSSTISGYSSGGTTSANPSTPGITNTIDKFPFATDTNATDVGDLSQARVGSAGQSSTTHGYTSGGDSPGISNVIDKFPFASDTNATDVGDLSQGRYAPAGQSSTTSGYSSGGGNPSEINTIDKFPFTSDTNASDVGDLTVARRNMAGQQARTLS